uniref:ARAD1C35574p n=1 Tax=Blastobotrys adeninivorans TaxID=409370 RepID=A0A060T2U1_BLAAD
MVRLLHHRYQLCQKPSTYGRQLDKMGKNTDKLFITHSEWSSGGHSASSGASNVKVHHTASAQPFWTCSISQQPIQEDSGVCDTNGFVYDIRNIAPYIRRNGTNPVTGEPMTNKDLIKVKLAKNSDGNYVDPVSLKEFQAFSAVVLIKPSGRVYFEDTVRTNNIKAKFWRDLVSDEPFTKSDIIKLQGGVGSQSNKRTDSSLEPSRKVQKLSTTDGSYGRPNESSNAPKSIHTSHHLASSATSTAVDVHTKAIREDIAIEKLLRQKKFNEPGYATIDTDLGQLRIELYPKYSPKAVYNFVSLAKSGYYNGVSFHRNIKHFMIQTGDPSGTGAGGRSAFPNGKPFADETNTPLKHDSRGIVSMANKGKNTNTSQFFITYRRTPHLDGKHTVFGKVIGGLDVLEKLELVPTDSADRPTTTIRMKGIKIQSDPFERGLHEVPNEEKDDKTQENDDDTPWLAPKATSSGIIGKYMTKRKLQDGANDNDDDGIEKRRKRTSLANSSFAGW